MRLLFVRHGQMEIRASAASDPSAIDRLFSQEDEGHLTERGRREAERVAERLRREGVHALYSSHLHRARETAEVVATALDLPLIVSERVSEIRIGALAYRSASAAFVRAVTGSRLPVSAKAALLSATLTTLYFRAWQAGTTVGGETVAELDARIDAFLAQLGRAHGPDETVAVVAHGYLITILTLRTGVRGRLQVWRRPYIPNGAICEMELGPAGLRSIRRSDAEHLRGLVR